MTQTLERPRHRLETQNQFSVDLDKIDVVSHLSEESSFEMQVSPPSAETSSILYKAIRKGETEESFGGTFLAFEKNADAFWQANDKPESIGVVRSLADGHLEQLGAGDDTSLSGRFQLTPDEAVYVIPNRTIADLRAEGMFNEDGLARVLSDDELNKEIVRFSFENALESRTATALNVPAENEPAVSVATPEKVPTPLELAAAIQAERSASAAKLVEEMNKSVLASSAAETTQSTNGESVTNEVAEEKTPSYKVTDLRRWSRIDVLGQEIGPHGRIDIKKLPNVQVESESATTLEAATEAIANPNDDPAVRLAADQLAALRNKAAGALSGWHDQLAGPAAKTRSEYMQAYNGQIATLAKLVLNDSLNSDTLSDSEKNVLVTEFLLKEQARLQVSMDEKSQTTKARKFINWMTVRDRESQPVVDRLDLIRTLEQTDDSDKDKIAVAHQRMAEAFQKHLQAERREHRKQTLRVAAMGAVGVAATLIGLNPAMVGDTVNSLRHTGL